MAPIFGETEDKCIKFKSDKLIKLEIRDTWNIGGCDWLAGKLMDEGWKLGGYNLFYNDAIPGAIETYILTNYK